jgi:peptidoglycan hydrolase CwlO-like protein
MKALNAKERNRAFLKFLLFFVFTLVLVVTAIYFDFKLPLKENSYLQKQIDQQRQIEHNQENFVNAMNEAVRLLDSLDKPGTDMTQIDAQLDQKMIELDGLKQKDLSAYGKMDRAILDKFLDLKRAKPKLKKLEEDEDKLARMKADLNDANTKLEEAQTALDAYRRK